MHAEADAEVGNPALARDLAGEDLALPPARAEAAGHEHAVDPLEQLRRLLVGHVLGVDPLDADACTLEETGVLERLVHREVGVVQLHTCPNRSSNGVPKLFGGSGCDIKAIYQSFRNAYPGETGPRNYIRLPGYLNVDIGLAKTWTMPWSEKHQLQLRWDVFNVANLQRFGLVDNGRTGIGVARDPGLRGLNPPDNWSNFTQIQGQPRVMQVGARYSF